MCVPHYSRSTHLTIITSAIRHDAPGLPLVVCVVLVLLPIVSAQPAVVLVNDVSLLFPESAQRVVGAVSSPIEQVTLPAAYGDTGHVSGGSITLPLWQVFYRSSPTNVSYVYQDGAKQ
jgi:hypothetical protein